jgi:ribosomal protein S19E (S16A)
MDDEKFMKKYNTISLFYQNYGLTKDGGYNKEKKLETNLKLISNLLKSFSNYMNIDAHKSKKEFCIYNGKPLVTDKIDEINIDKIDTYAFVKKNLLSYTENIIKTENNIKIEIFE